ncbi:MAG: hypothetical protein A2W35_14070 [Chloroflexi bacterium RBG_16_57_11]|nr:MAG: hypothetical protein A2W35_14070 [Chloroflexi bacterium RBG_16_57_11]
MPIFMTQFAYTVEGWKSLTRNPEDRSVPLRALIDKLGGKLLNIYYSFGDYDGVVIMEAPDAQTVVTALLAIVNAGHVSSLKTSQLFTTQEGMEAMAKANKIVYPAPKG